MHAIRIIVMRFKNVMAIRLLLLIVCWAFAVSNASAGQEVAQRKQKRLVIINSYNSTTSWVQDYITMFMMEAASRKNLHCNVVHMNGTLVMNDSAFHHIENGIFERFKDKKPDYLVLVGQMAFLLRDRIKEEWGDIPFIYMGIYDDFTTPEHTYSGMDSGAENAEYEQLRTVRNKYNFTFVEIPNFYRETIDMMVKMQPQMKKLVFASDELSNNVRLNRDIKEYVESKYHDMDYEWVVANEKNSERLQELFISDDLRIGILLSSLYYPRKSAFGYPILVTDEMRLVAASTRPVFTIKETYLDDGAVGGYFLDVASVKEHCQKVFMQMLNGKSMRNIPFYYSSYSSKAIPIVDYKQMEEAGIDEDNCPDGTVFVNREGKWWDYKWQILAAIIVVLSIISIMAFALSLKQRRVKMLASHERMLNNMPICYMQARVKRVGDKIEDITFVSSNDSANLLVSKNTEEGSISKLFDSELLKHWVKKLYETKKNVRTTHYFENTKRYYEFIICQTINNKEIEIFGIDITDKVNSEQYMKESAKKLEMILDLANIMPWRWNLTERKFLYESRPILRHLTGKSISVRTKSMGEIDFFSKIHSDDKERMKRLCYNLYHAKIDQVRDEFRIITNLRGVHRIDWLEINASVGQYDAKGMPTLIIGSLLFITERKNQEEALIAAREAAMESDRLKSAFLANMSHEIRTPLNAIVGFSSLLATTDDEAERKEFIKIIEINNEHLLTLINDILDLAKVEANSLEFIFKPTDLNELMGSLKKTIQIKVKEGVMLNCMLGASDCHIMTDQSRLSQVMINFLTNAAKFTEKGSISFGYEFNDDNLYFFVRDTGAGIAPEDQAKVFQRFVKLDVFKQGTGLGLPICKSIVERFGGEIGVTSKGKGHGTTFWFTIPYKPA